MRESTPSALSLLQDTLIVIADDVFLRSGLGLTQTSVVTDLSQSPLQPVIYTVYIYHLLYIKTAMKTVTIVS